MKKIKWLLLFLMCVTVLGGCGKNEIPADATVVYYLNKAETSLVPVEYEITGDSTEIQLEGVLAKLEEIPESVDLKKTIPDNVKILNYTLDRKILFIDFNAEYYNLPKTTEVLVRAAVVKSVVQIEGISFVGLRVNGEGIKDSKGNSVGLMSENMFLDNMGSEENATKIETLNLYFANKAGNMLKNQTTVIEYNANVGLEKVVVEQLIAGPTEKGYYPTIPKDTKVMSVTTKDGVCYVNLDAGFTTQGYDVLGSVTIYSIVNSLTSLQGITSVQILVNGETSITYKDNISLETTFQRNQEIIVKEK